MNLYNGSDYEVLYPKTAASNLDGTLSDSQIPNLSTSKITRGTLPVSRGGTGTTSLSTLASNLSSYLNIPSSSSFLPISGGTLTGDLTIKGAGNFGTKLNLGDGDYVHISEPTDDCMEIKAKKVNFVLSDGTDSKFTINGNNPFGGANSDSIKQIWNRPNILLPSTTDTSSGSSETTTKTISISSVSDDLIKQTSFIVFSSQISITRQNISNYYGTCSLEISGINIPIGKTSSYTGTATETYTMNNCILTKILGNLSYNSSVFITGLVSSTHPVTIDYITNGISTVKLIVGHATVSGSFSLSGYGF